MLPDVERVVKLLGDGKVGKVPGVAVVEDVLRVAADCNRLARGDARVDGIGRAEAVDVDLKVGQRLVAARLEGRRITADCRVENVDSGQNRVDILARAAGGNVDCAWLDRAQATRASGLTIGDDVAAGVPEALLVAQDVGGNGNARAALGAKLGSKSSTLDQSCFGRSVRMDGNGRKQTKSCTDHDGWRQQ